MAKKSDKELIPRVLIINGIVTIILALIKYGSFVTVAFIFYLTVDSLAGKITDANIFFSLLVDIKDRIGWWAVFIFGCIGWAYGISRAKLLKKYISRNNDRIDMLEKTINPKKQSSGISKDGTQNKELKKWLP